MTGIPAARTVGAVHIVQRTDDIVLYFPPLRAAGSALTLALFGSACSVIGLAAIAGLVRSGETAASSMLALAFAGVFALPLLMLGQLFIVIAVWTAANSLQVEVRGAGLRMARKWFGYTLARREIARGDIIAVESRLAARYLGAFGAARYYRLFARARNLARPLLIADSLRGTGMTEEIRQLVIAQLGAPELATAGRQAHFATEDPA
ncbi:MAG: hypothetical protein ABIS45_04580 [Burkholderiales bacterium]